MNFVASISYPTSKKKLRYRWSKSVGLEPPPNIVPDIEIFYFDIEVMTSGCGKERRIGASSWYRTLYRSFLLRYQSHDLWLRYRSFWVPYIVKSSKYDFDTEVKNFDIEVQTMLLVLDQPISCWGPWLKWAQLGGDSKGPSASANLRLGPASSGTSVSPAHSHRTLYRILVLKQLFFTCSSPALQQAVRRRVGMLDATKYQSWLAFML